MVRNSRLLSLYPPRREENFAPLLTLRFSCLLSENQENQQQFVQKLLWWEPYLDRKERHQEEETFYQNLGYFS